MFRTISLNPSPRQEYPAVAVGEGVLLACPFERRTWVDVEIQRFVATNRAYWINCELLSLAMSDDIPSPQLAPAAPPSPSATVTAEMHINGEVVGEIIVDEMEVDLGATPLPEEPLYYGDCRQVLVTNSYRPLL